MSILENYLPQIVESLKSIDPYKVYLFGSVSTSTDKEDSDIDLAVILNSDERPSTYEERLKNKVYVRNSILDISMEVPIDLIVYTKEEFKYLTNSKSPFIAEIINKGSVIYG